MMKGLRIVGMLAMAFAVAHCGDNDVHVSTDPGVKPAPGTFTGTLIGGGSIRLEVGSIDEIAEIAFDCNNKRIEKIFPPPGEEINSDGSFDVAFTDRGREFHVLGTFEDNNKIVDGKIEDQNNECDASYVATRENVLPTPTPTGLQLTATPAKTPTATPTATPTSETDPIPTPTSTTDGPTSTSSGGGGPTPSPTASPCVPAGTGTCGNCVNDPGEKCDASAPAAGWATCGPDFACVACNCACPTKVSFTGDATASASVLDTGWSGISHRAPIISGGTATVTLSGCASKRPCGTCTVSGPVANGPGQIDSQRCTNDTSIPCTTNTPCTAGGGTCQFFFGSNLPLAAGGVTVCAVNQFNGPVSGTANVETGEALTVANLTARVYNGFAIDNPCARCVGDATINDSVKGGTCDNGMHVGQTCDGNGTVANRPDFGTTSLDCPSAAGALIATLPIDLSNATAPVTKTLSASSPACTDAPGERCLCDTCNNLAATPCDSNADCGGAGVCGGKRCLGGTTAGAPCVNPTDCVTGICGRPGAGTKSSGCIDDTTTEGLDCVDGNGDGEGECTGAPIDNNCSVASGHAQRGCTPGTAVADCGGAGTCISAHRLCFLTGGLTVASKGTDTLTAVGMAAAPMADTSNPTLGAVFCVGPTGRAAIDGVSGLPGPGRVTIKGKAIGLP